MPRDPLDACHAHAQIASFQPQAAVLDAADRRLVLLLDPGFFGEGRRRRSADVDLLLSCRRRLRICTDLPAAARLPLRLELADATHDTRRRWPAAAGDAGADEDVRH